MDSSLHGVARRAGPLLVRATENEHMTPGQPALLLGVSSLGSQPQTIKTT